LEGSGSNLIALHYPTIRLKQVTEEATKILSQEVRPLGRDLNRDHPNMKQECQPFCRNVRLQSSKTRFVSWDL